MTNETVTPMRWLMLTWVRGGHVRSGEDKPNAASWIYSDVIADSGIARPELNRALHWLLRSGYGQVSGDQYPPPAETLVVATAQGIAELRAGDGTVLAWLCKIAEKAGWS
ncbi:hypothetical protein [Labedaea rhizosphaerae]|uniref:hypothetical protein n=1 Tax=Labedaea rhizosphaerae TaxID=598644 RepID=UPI001060CA21|nr:hypothetical protein [Labedaea rhizosphaerae]